jgi:uncharacterized coiled-coil protein SlyX
MCNDFGDRNDLESLEMRIQDVDLRLSEQRANVERLNAQLRITELRETRQRLEDLARSIEAEGRLIASAEEADQLISSPGFRERFCRLYQQLMNNNVATTIDVVHDIVDVLIEILGYTIPPVRLSFLAIGILRKVADGFCQEFINSY